MKLYTNLSNSIVKNTVTHGAETWKFNKNLESKLMPMEMGFLRISARCSTLQKIRNNVFGEKINIKNPVLDYVRHKQLNWYGHVERVDQ